MVTGKIKQKLAWIFLGKRLLLSDNFNLKCPRCGSKLNKINKQIKPPKEKETEVVIDVCSNCQGIWLDDGEIDKLVIIAKHEFSKKTKNNKKVNNKLNNKKSKNNKR